MVIGHNSSTNQKIKISTKGHYLDNRNISTTGPQKFNNSKIQKFINSEIHKFRNSKNQLSRSLATGAWDANLGLKVVPKGPMASTTPWFGYGLDMV